MIRRLDYLIWLTESIARKIGFWGLVGLLMLGLSLGIHFLHTRSLQARSHALASEIHQLQYKAEARKSTPVSPEETNENILTNQSVNNIPDIIKLPEILKTIYELAKKEGIELDIGDYRLVKLKSDSTQSTWRLTRYELAFPVTGKYPNIRQFISNVLAENRSIALTEFYMQKEAIAASSVDTELKFVLFLKGSDD